MSNHHAIVSHHEAGSGSFRTYLTGFLMSVGLTLAAYSAVTHHWAANNSLVAIIIGLGSIQLIVQLIFFLHLGRESKPRWNLIVFSFMLSVLVIIVFGSLWIMNNLDYHHGADTPAEINNSIIRDEGYQN